MTTVVYFGGGKGGTGKSTNTHLACLGAILCNQPATYVLTAPEREPRGAGRPYSVLDGRAPHALASILTANSSTLNGWLFIDGGGNRPAFDQELAKKAHLVFLPFRASQEDVDMVKKDMRRIAQAIAWPTAWSTNSHARHMERRGGRETLRVWDKFGTTERQNHPKTVPSSYEWL